MNMKLEANDRNLIQSTVLFGSSKKRVVFLIAVLIAPILASMVLPHSWSVSANESSVKMNEKTIADIEGSEKTV